MASRSLNKVELIGNLTGDPELKYTPNGNAVCTFSIATNRSWTTEAGEKREESDFHRIVVWNKLAEICSQYLSKGRKVYVEGRLANRSWLGQDGQKRFITEVVIDDMIILDNTKSGGSGIMPQGSAQRQPVNHEEPVAQASVQESGAAPEGAGDAVAPDDIPF